MVRSGFNAVGKLRRRAAEEQLFLQSVIDFAEQDIRTMDCSDEMEDYHMWDMIYP